MPSTAEAIVLVAIFLVPGYVWQRVYSLFAPRRFAEGHHFVLECIWLSALVHAIFYIPSLTIYYRHWETHHPYFLFVYSMSVVIIAPAILGLLTARAFRKRRLDRIADWLGVQLIHSMQTAWDSFLWFDNPPRWALVTLKNGSRIGGYAGQSSFVGDGTHDKDIFLEGVAKIDSQGKFVGLQAGSLGVWISSSEIAFIEFLKVPERTENGRAEAPVQLED